MYTLLKPLQIRDQLIKRDMRIFTVLDFQRLFNLPVYKTKYILEKNAKEGLFIRLKKGLYALSTDLPSEEQIANALYQPSYISFEYALAFYNAIKEMPYQITSATTKPTRQYSVMGKQFNYYTIKKSVFTGYSLIESNGKSYFIANKEKAMADLIYFNSLNKKPIAERLEKRVFDWRKVKQYLNLYKREKMLQIVNQLI